MIEKKAEKKEDKQPVELSDEEIEALINQGMATPKQKQINQDVRFHLRLSQDTINKIDKQRKKQDGFISRNTWILRAIQNELAKFEIKD